MKIIKPFLFLVAALALLVVGIVEYLNFSGFCYAESRYLGDQELILNAIKYNLHSPPISNGLVPYTSPDDLLAKNPRCCAVYREDRKLLEEFLFGRWVRIFGQYIMAVQVKYELSDDPERKHLDSYVAITACGKVLQSEGRYLSSSYKP